MATWENKTYPDGCRHCATTERRSLGRGLCSKCYQDSEIKEAYGLIRKGLSGVMETYKTLDTDTDSSGEDYLSSRDGDAYPMGESSYEEEVAPVTSERRPGSDFSPLSESGGGPAPEPVSPKAGLRAWFSKKQKPEAPDYEPEPEPKAKKTRHLGRRVSAADSLADVWGGLGSTAMRAGHVPTGRLMQFQSQVAGEMLDEALKGSLVDRKLLQPIVKSRGRFDLISAVVGPPLLVMAIERDPSKAELLIPVLKSQIRSSLPLMLPAIKKVQEKERKAAEAAAELFPDLPEGQDPVDAIIAMLFADFQPTTVMPTEADEPVEVEVEVV